MTEYEIVANPGILGEFVAADSGRHGRDSIV